MIGIIITTIIAIVFGIMLTLLTNRYKDDSKLKELLPGYNCGACGFGGCEALANEIAKDPEMYKKCRILRGDNLEKMKEYLRENYNLKE